jgi:hypothetical protein
VRARAPLPYPLPALRPRGSTGKQSSWLPRLVRDSRSALLCASPRLRGEADSPQGLAGEGLRARCWLTRILAPLVLGLLACRTTGAVAPPPPQPGAVDSGRLVPTQELAPDFSLRQRIEGRYGDKAVPAIDAVLQLRAGHLQLVALTPFGTRALVIHQRGTEITTEAFIDKDKLPPLDPKDILRDIHRVLFRGLFVGKAAPAGGVHTGRDGDDDVVETWRAGQLQTRTFAAPGTAADAPAVRIEFEGKGELVAPTVRLTNLRLGYQLVIKTFDQQRLR